MTVKIRVSVEVDIDPQAWATEYGFDPSQKIAICDDVKAYVREAVHQHLEGAGMLAEQKD